MSVHGIAASAAQSNTMMKVDFSRKTRKKVGELTASAIGTLPLGAGTKLLAGAVQSLGQAAAKAQPTASLGGLVDLTA